MKLSDEDYAVLAEQDRDAGRFEAMRRRAADILAELMEDAPMDDCDDDDCDPTELDDWLETHTHGGAFEQGFADGLCGNGGSGRPNIPDHLTAVYDEGYAAGVVERSKPFAPVAADDDENRAYFIGDYASTFATDAYSDYDPMYADAPGDGSYKCGRGPYRDIPCCLDDSGTFIGPGCRHCNPPDRECKPYGFGIEKFDNEPRLSLLRELQATAWFTGLTWDQCRACATAWSGFDVALARKSDRVWDCLCDKCETHTQAVERYKRWAIKRQSK